MGDAKAYLCVSKVSGTKGCRCHAAIMEAVGRSWHRSRVTAQEFVHEYLTVRASVYTSKYICICVCVNETLHTCPTRRSAQPSVLIGRVSVTVITNIRYIRQITQPKSTFHRLMRESRAIHANCASKGTITSGERTDQTAEMRRHLSKVHTVLRKIFVCKYICSQCT